MPQALQASVDGLLLGSVYGLGGIGFGFLFMIRQRIDLAYGACLMSGLYAIVALSNAGAVAVITSPMVGLLTVGVVLAYCHWLCFPWGDKRPAITAVAASFALSMQIEETVSLGMPFHYYAFPLGSSSGDWWLGPLAVRPDLVLVALVAALVALALSRFMSHARAGRALRAWSQNAPAASLCGISPFSVWLLTLAVACLLGGIAAIAVAVAEQAVTPMFGLSITLKSLVVFAIGGAANIRGPVIGGYVLGFVEAHAKAMLQPQLREAVIFALLFVLLAARSVVRANARSIPERQLC